MKPRRLVVLASAIASTIVVGLFAGAAVALPTHNDDGNDGKRKHTHDMPGMTKAEMAAHENEHEHGPGCNHDHGEDDDERDTADHDGGNQEH